MSTPVTKILLGLVILSGIVAFFLLDAHQYLTLDNLKVQQQAFSEYYQANTFQTLLIFFVVYVLITALSLPGAAIMTLLAGALFGLVTGLILVSFASTLGATLAFLSARYLFRDIAQKKFGHRLTAINEGIVRDGAFYLFTLRLVPVFPFFVINLVFGLTQMKALTFAWVSQLGMLAGTIVFVNAGTQLGQIDSLAGILSPGLILSFVILGVFPLLAKKTIEWIKARQVYRGYSKPKHFDNNIVVIGAGSGGLVSALIAATVKAKVTLIERHKMGGDCLNTGCVPSKAIIKSARYQHLINNPNTYGFDQASSSFDFKKIMQRVHKIIKTIEPNDSIERYEGLGVNVITGHARVTSPYTVEVNGETITTKNIILATGARPWVPEIPGLDQVNHYTSDTLWSMTEQPKRMVVLGGGPIGSELAQSFARLGTHVTQIQRQSRLLHKEDPDVSALVVERFRAEGITVHLQHTAVEVQSRGDAINVICESADGQRINVECDALLIAIGRKANSTGFGLEALGIDYEDNGTLKVNDYLQTRYPNIYACGDLIGPYQFTHTASHEAWFCAVNALFGRFKKFKADYSVIPWATFTEPEVARVGLNEADAKAQGVDYEVTTFPLDDLDRAIAESATEGFIKVLTPAGGSDKILGVTIVGEHAGDLIAEYILAMKNNIGLNKILGTIHIYPTLAEANKMVAGRWKKAHKPEKLLDWVSRYHAWER